MNKNIIGLSLALAGLALAACAKRLRTETPSGNTEPRSDPIPDRYRADRAIALLGLCPVPRGSEGTTSCDQYLQTLRGKAADFISHFSSHGASHCVGYPRIASASTSFDALECRLTGAPSIRIPISISTQGLVEYNKEIGKMFANGNAEEVARFVYGQLHPGEKLPDGFIASGDGDTHSYAVTLGKLMNSLPPDRPSVCIVIGGAWIVGGNVSEDVGHRLFCQ